MRTTTFQFTFPPATPSAPPLVDIVAQLQSTYANPLQDSFQELWTSSAHIIQQQAAKAAMESFFALTRNAAEVQQRTFFQLFAAHQQALTMWAEAWMSALMGGMRPGRP